MGRYKREQPVLAEESIGPALMIAPASTSPAALAFAEDAAYPHPNPAVQPRKRVLVTVLEILKPAPGRAIDVRDDVLQALTVRALGLAADRSLV